MKKVMLTLTILLFLFTVSPALAQDGNTVTLLHFSDYHSHAAPFYAEGQANAAGIARAMAYLQPYAGDPNTLIFNGGDMLNVGAMGWSDKYQCVEWSWLNGIVDAMAYGNHDADYGPDAFAACQAQIDYPILSANILDANGRPLFQYNGKTYQVFAVNGVKIGVFAVAGPDFDRLVKPEVRPVAGASFGDSVQAAQEVVNSLREEEKVAAVVMVGHGLYEDNIALAQAVPGIDLIFGTHSHRREALTQLPETNTYFISPFQYLTYISQVELTFDRNGQLARVSGRLVPMSNDLPQDPAIAQQVNQMQADLEADPDYAALFEPIGEAAIELSTEGQFTGEGLLGNFVMDIFRERSQAHMALSTSSAFRQPLPPGPITPEILRSAMPYPNPIFVFDLTGAQVEALLNYGLSRKGSDFFPQVSGVRFNTTADRASNIQILNHPATPAEYGPLDPAATYKVATSNFVGLFAGGYKDIFAGAPYTDTGLEIREEVTKYLQANSPVSAQLDGRMTIGEAPLTLPESGGRGPEGWIAPALGIGLLVLGLAAARRSVSR
ncbi:MAG: 5'-nucleotidase C-terminal domain-containing protein [Anaerolineae bacterium]|nr:5'-nucleotidase C-terminal domain-containing protein [Anaerolineae bacterium]